MIQMIGTKDVIWVVDMRGVIMAEGIEDATKLVDLRGVLYMVDMRGVI